MQPSPLHQPMTLTATSSISPLMVDLWLAPVGTGNVALRLAYEGANASNLTATLTGASVSTNNLFSCS